MQIVQIKEKNKPLRIIKLIKIDNNVRLQINQEKTIRFTIKNMHTESWGCPINFKERTNSVTAMEQLGMTPIPQSIPPGEEIQIETKIRGVKSGDFKIRWIL
jgi:hypothetical protein